MENVGMDGVVRLNALYVVRLTTPARRARQSLRDAPPQHTRRPSSVRPQVESPRASIATKRSGLCSRSGRGLFTDRVSTPSCPYSFEPQQYATRFAIAQL